jgi:aspartate aminotransferase/aminotransferase
MIHEPAWLSYPEQARLAGLNPKFIPFDCPIEKFVDYYSSKTKILVICNPNNPSGRLYTAEELKKIYDAAASRNIYVLVDEAYSDFVIDSGFRSMADIVPSKKGIIVVNSLSKNFGMSGWRIGYVIANKHEINALLKVNQHLITCAPTLLLMYLSRYFDDILKVTIPQVKEVVNKRNRVLSMMKSIGLDYLDGGTTFYFFVNIGKFPGSSLELSLYLLLNFNISVSPGSAYGENTDRFIRISIGTESDERIYIALQTINDVLHEDDFDKNELNSKLLSRGFHSFKE